MLIILYGATVFNQDISSWDVSNVNHMGSMFCGATAFNQDLNAWDVSNVNHMGNMFLEAHAFNQNLSAWNINNMEGVFLKTYLIQSRFKPFDNSLNG